MEWFLEYVSVLDINHHEDLLSSLREIQAAIRKENYEDYKNGFHRYVKSTGKLKEKDEKLLNTRVKNTSHHKNQLVYNALCVRVVALIEHVRDLPVSCNPEP